MSYHGILSSRERMLHVLPADVFELDTESVQGGPYALSGGKNVFYRYAPDGDRHSRAEMTDQIRSDDYVYYPKSDLVRIVGEYAYRYDENGNLLERGDVYVESGEEIAIEQSGDYTLLEYDLLNRLVSVSKIDEDTGALKQVVSYRYNHKNLRIERTDDEGTPCYVFDLAGNIIEEHDAEGLTHYVFRNNKHLAKITSDGKTYYYGTDNLGSTTVLFDEDGNVVWNGEISAFGDVVLGEWIGEALFDERVRFTGKNFDEVTGLYYFNARWYDPLLGRFTSEDPARDGMNWYVYVRNNPLGRIDPSGLITLQIGTSSAGGGGVGGTFGTGLVFAWNKSEPFKIEIGKYFTEGGGSHFGANASSNFDISLSLHNKANDISGPAVSYGGSGGLPIGPVWLGAGIENTESLNGAKPTTTVSLTAGVGSYEAHIYYTETQVQDVKEIDLANIKDSIVDFMSDFADSVVDFFTPEQTATDK